MIFRFLIGFWFPNSKKNTDFFAKFREISHLEGFGDLRKVPRTFSDQKILKIRENIFSSKKYKTYEKLKNISKDELLTPPELGERSEKVH